MREKWIAIIGGGNSILFIASVGEFLKFGTQAFAFLGAGLSLTLLVHKEKDTIRKIFGRGGGNSEK